MFIHLERASLTLNLEKCVFGQATVTYLGKQVGQGQVKPVEVKVMAIMEFPVNVTQRELSRFLGMVDYYRNFCKNFSTVVTSLTNLLSPKKATEECQLAFENEIVQFIIVPQFETVPQFERCSIIKLKLLFQGNY